MPWRQLRWCSHLVGAEPVHLPDIVARHRPVRQYWRAGSSDTGSVQGRFGLSLSPPGGQWPEQLSSTSGVACALSPGAGVRIHCRV